MISSCSLHIYFYIVLFFIFRFCTILLHFFCCFFISKHVTSVCTWFVHKHKFRSIQPRPPSYSTIGKSNPPGQVANVHKTKIQAYSMEFDKNVRSIVKKYVFFLLVYLLHFNRIWIIHQNRNQDQKCHHHRQHLLHHQPITICPIYRMCHWICRTFHHRQEATTTMKTSILMSYPDGSKSSRRKNSFQPPLFFRSTTIIYGHRGTIFQMLCVQNSHRFVDFFAKYSNWKMK